MAAIVQAKQKCVKWPPNHKYCGPCKCKCKIRYVQPEKPVSFKPVSTFKPSECKINDGTTYKMSYYGFDPNVVKNCRGYPKIAKESLAPSGEFSGDTTHKMSYGAWPGYKPPDKVIPCDHKLMGEGPVSQITTHKHDYTAKPLQEVERVVHPGNLGFSGEPMEDQTTANMSYKYPDLNRFVPATSFKPQQRFNPPSDKLDDKTTHKLSYQPFCPPEREELPWAQKGKYQPPKVPFEGNTVYNGSYFAPGQFVEECPEGPAICCCAYPCECCDAAGDAPKAHQFEECPPGYFPVSSQQAAGTNGLNPGLNNEC